MGILTAVSTAVLLAPCLVQGNSESVLTIRAWVNTAGPYGESWTLIVPAGGDVSLEILYHLSPMGKMSGEFCVTAERLLPIKEAIESERFMELPSRFQPEVTYFHKPTLRVRVTLGERQHEVELYDPDALADDPRARRFRAVWDEIFELVPLQPTWWQPQSEGAL